MATTTYVVNEGLDILTNRISGSGTEPKYIAWGTGTTAAAVTDAALETESAEESRTTGTSSRQTTNTTNDTYRVTGTVTCATSAKAITEVGLLDASSSGNLFLRSTFSAINLAVGDAITFTIDTVFDQA